MGYALLDYSDRYQMRGVGLYMARQGVLLKWPLPEFLGNLTGGDAHSLADLRPGFRELLEAIGSKQEEAKRIYQEHQEYKHRKQQAKWAREVVRRWHDVAPQTLPKRQRNSLERAQKLLDEYKQEKVQRLRQRERLHAVQ